MAYVQTKDGVALYVKDWGIGRPVVLIHGWPLSADTWDDTAIALSDAGYRVIAYDRRGFGRSSQPWNGYDYDALTDDLHTIIAETGVKDATIVGFSMGGGEVARYMSRHQGARVVQAALVASIVPYLLKTIDNVNGVDASVFESIVAAVKQDRFHFFAGFFRSFFGVDLGTHPVTDELLSWALTLAMQASLRSTLECANSFAFTDFRADLASFNVPTLIIHGTQDAIVPIDTSARAAAKEIAGAQLIEYEGAPHGLFATHKQRLTQDLLQFLRR